MTEMIHTQTTFPMSDVMQVAYNSATPEEKARIDRAVEYLQKGKEVTHDGMKLTVINSRVYLNVPSAKDSLQMAIDRKRYELALLHALSHARFPKFREGETYWFVDPYGDVSSTLCQPRVTFDRALMLMGNYFNTESEARVAKDDILKKYKTLEERNII